MACPPFCRTRTCSVGWSVGRLQRWADIDVTLAFEDDQIIPPYSRREDTDDTDNTDDTEDTGNTDDTDDTDDTDNKDDTDNTDDTDVRYVSDGTNDTDNTDDTDYTDDTGISWNRLEKAGTGWN